MNKMELAEAETQWQRSSKTIKERQDGRNYPLTEKTLQPTSLVPENAAAKHAATAFLFPPLHGAVNVFICAEHFFSLAPTTEGSPKKKKRGGKKGSGHLFNGKRKRV